MTLVPETNENFYELAWKVRLDLIEKWCDEPGANALRVIRKLELHEMQYRLFLDRTRDPKTGETFFTGGHEWTARPADPDTALPTGVPPFVTVALRDREISVPVYADFGGIPARWIAHHCQNLAYDAIVELGCGTGRNIFSIFYNGGPAGPYFAAEFTESGRHVTERLARLEPAISITVVPFDHKAPDFSFLAGFKSVLLFSVHSIEQVETLPADYFDKLASAADRVAGMHFEPFGFQLGRGDPVAVRQRKWFADQGWNTDLLEKLRDAETRGVIKLTFLSDNLFSNTMENPTSVAIWRARKGGGKA